MIRPTLRCLPVAVVFLSIGCGGWQSALDPRSPGAATIESLWWIAFTSTGILSSLTILGLLYAVHRAHRRAAPETSRHTASREQTFILIAGVGIPTLFLIGFLTLSVRAGTAVSEHPEEATVMLEVVGHQFWWEVHYPNHGVVTANEIHIPVGEPVEVHITSADVIHSFWIPQLAPGKLDMNPGRFNTLWLFAEEAGLYRGQCTEFCGVQHAHMALLVVASPPEEFEEWLDARRGTPPEPTDPEAARGREVFLEAGCSACHAIRGVSRPRFAGNPGPDLTDLGSRSSLGALTIPNDREHLAQWILEPDRFKPGVRMPPTPLDDADLAALVRYLEGLR